MQGRAKPGYCSDDLSKAHPGSGRGQRLKPGSDYLAVFIPGGHGAVVGLAVNCLLDALGLERQA